MPRPRKTATTSYTARRSLSRATALAGCAWLAFAWVAAAQDNSAFVKDLRAQNAHHVTTKITFPREPGALTVEREWERKLTRRSWELADGPLKITISLKQGGPPDGMLFVSPVLTLAVDGKQVARVEGSESFPDNPVFLAQIAEMDPGNRYREVVFSTFTGGAHCCSDTIVLTSARDGKSWRTIELGAFDGEPLKVRDIDGDGRFEFVMRDNAFLYRFGCYACSTAPLQVLQLSNGKFNDVSGAPAYRKRQLESLTNMIEWADGEIDRNGYLAGYVAQKILLGEGAEAWKLMEKHHDRQSDWGREVCTVKENDKGECPPGKQVMLSYPEALRRFLESEGYELKQ